jgi:hypothetical protein
VLQLSFAAALALILGALLSWNALGPGVETTIGRISILIAVAAIMLAFRLVRAARASDSGGVAALGLLATVLLGVELWARDTPPAEPGLYLSAGASVVLLICGIHLLGAKEAGPRDRRGAD